MIKAGAIEKGICILHKNEPFLVSEREFINPGKGSAFVRVKLKSLKTGQVLRETIKSQESVEEIQVDSPVCQYLYSDSEAYYFMDTESYEQFQVSISGHEEKELFMREGDSYKVLLWNETPIDIELPYKMVYEVTEAADGVKGDTVTGATKIVTLETGLKVKVPIFIKQGERIMINTETKEYVERVNR